MVRRRVAGTPGSRFAFAMVIILVVLALLLLSIPRHGSRHPNAPPPPSEKLLR